MGLAVAFLLPLSFYVIVKLLKKDKIDLPDYYVVERIDSSVVDGNIVADTVYHQVADLRLINQLGKEVSLNEDLKDKILVVYFFFTNCPSVCPRLTQNMRMFQTAFRKDKKKERSMVQDVQLISITVNPERDSFPVLRAYADRYGVNHDHWWFLTGDKQDIYEYARNELRVIATPGNGGAEDFIHTEKIVVLDRNRYIRGYYDGLDSVDVGRAAYDISLLTIEKNRKKQKD